MKVCSSDKTVGKLLFKIFHNRFFLKVVCIAANYDQWSLYLFLLIQIMLSLIYSLALLRSVFQLFFFVLIELLSGLKWYRSIQCIFVACPRCIFMICISCKRCSVPYHMECFSVILFGWLKKVYLFIKWPQLILRLKFSKLRPNFQN